MLKCLGAICPAASCEALLGFSFQEGEDKEEQKKENLLQTALNSEEGQIYVERTSLLLAADGGEELKTALRRKDFHKLQHSSLCCQ